jgi:hypothetical protein
MIDFETGVKWCGENKLFYNLDVRRDPSEIEFFITIYSRDIKGEIEDFVTGKGPNKDEAMRNARSKWKGIQQINTSGILHLCLDMIDQHLSDQSYVIKPIQQHPAPYDMEFLVATLRQTIANHLKE